MNSIIHILILATVIGGGGLRVQDSAWTCIDKPTQEEQEKTEMFYSAYESQDPFMQEGGLNGSMPTVDIMGEKREELFYSGEAVLMDAVSVLDKRDMLYDAILNNAKINGPDKETFYCHSDHLGSANWITEASGKPIQYMQYAPFGELLINETEYGYDERYKFTGKERDAETGYDYFGARYYSYALGGHWLSVDPMSDKYPHITPYAYCNWNPVKFVDPDGNEAKMTISSSTITFQAVYYARPKDIKSVTQAVNFWNKQNSLQYTDKRGNTYSVKFNLSVKKIDNPHNGANLGGAYANSYEVVPQLSTETSTPGAKATGLTKSDNRSIEVRSDRADGLTGAHEVGHTLMNINTKDGEHSTSGIMTGNANDPQRSEYVSQETVNTMVESHGINDNSIWSKIKSVFE